MGEAQDALKLIASHGLMPPRQTYKKNVFINYLQDYPIEKRFRCVDRTGWYGNSFVTTSRTYGNNVDEELLFHSEMKDPYGTMGTLEGWQELSRLIEPHALAVLSFACAFSGQLITPLDIESGGFHIYGTSTDGKSTITKAACSVWGKPKTYRNHGAPLTTLWKMMLNSAMIIISISMNYGRQFRSRVGYCVYANRCTRKSTWQ